MILSEPSPTSYDVNFRVFGVPVRIHPLFWLVSLIWAGRNPPSVAVVFVIAILISITIHELGHVLAFRYFGVRSYVVLHAFGGLAIPSGQYGFGRARMTPAARAIIAFAGPAVQILSAYLLFALVKLAGVRAGFPPEGIFRFIPFADIESRYLYYFVNYYFIISIFWALINLLPIIPLDGGRIAQVLFESADPRTGTRQALILSMIMSGLVAALMLVQFRDWFSAVFFVYLGAMNYQTFNSLDYRGDRW